MSKEVDELFMPITPPDALQQILIQVLRQQGDSTDRLVKAVEIMGGDVKEVRDRIVQLEAAKLEAQIARVEADCESALKEAVKLTDERFADYRRNVDDKESRLRSLEGVVIKMGVGMAIVALIGGSVLTFLLKQLFGAS